jgi:hypothetical protein
MLKMLNTLNMLGALGALKKLGKVGIIFKLKVLRAARRTFTFLPMIQQSNVRCYYVRIGSLVIVY